MKQWDYWRAEIANGHKGTAPRDWFESVLDLYEEEIESAALEYSHPTIHDMEN